MSLQNMGASVETERQTEINAFRNLGRGKITDIDRLCDDALFLGHSMAELRARAHSNLKTGVRIEEHNPNIGMSSRDCENYSIVRAVQMSVSGKFSGLEAEAHNAAVSAGAKPQSDRAVVIPFDVLSFSKRDQLTSTASLGGNLVQTHLLAGSFIDQLTNRMAVAKLGATFLPGLVGNVAIPRATSGATTYWMGSETASTTESSVTWDQVTMTPKQITARVDYSWQTLLQTTPGIEMLLRNDLNTRIALAIDLAAIHGTGTGGQPTGISATSGIGSVTLGAAGGAPTWAAIVALEAALANANADENIGYLTNSKVRAKLKTVLKNSSGTDGNFILNDDMPQDGFYKLNGGRLAISNQVTSTGTKSTSTSVCSTLAAGNWADLLVGLWSGLQILTDPYSAAGQRLISIYAYQACDVSVRHPESFATIADVLTT